MNDLLTGLAHANLAACAAILPTLALRKPVRRWLGARAAYGLWIATPLAAAATLLPALPAAPRLTLPPAADAPVQMAVTWAEQGGGGGDIDWVLRAWALGALVSFALLAWRQHRFMRLAAKGLAGPAVIGVLFPRIVAPDDFETRFSEAERHVILAHERAHLSRQDARVTGLIAFLQCLCWFNPLVHVAAFHARLDQELACDAEVMARLPHARRTYAQAMLKTQLAPAPLPLGCYWPPRSIHPLEARIAMLNRPLPTLPRRIVGAVLAALMAIGLGYAAWAAGPGQGSALGSAGAKVTVIEYASTTCPHCARWNADVFPAFKAKYVDTGLVRYELREFPTAPQAASVAGFLIARCAPPAKYFDVIDALFRGQAEMAASGDARATLLKAGRAGGLTDAKSMACAQDPQATAALDKRVRTAAEVDKIRATPTFIIGNQRLEGEQPLAALDAVIQPLLAAKAGAAAANGTGLTMRVVDDTPAAATRPGNERASGPDGELWLTPGTPITAKMVAAAQPTTDREGRPTVNFTLTPEGKDRFAALSRANVGKRIAILFNGQVVSAPLVREPMTGGAGQVSGALTTDTARELAGKMAPVRPAASRTPRPVREVPIAATTARPTAPSSQAEAGPENPAPIHAVIHSVTVLGAHRIEPATILSYVPIHPGDEVDNTSLIATVKSLGHTALFSDIMVGVNGDQLVVRVVEKPAPSPVS